MEKLFLRSDGDGRSLDREPGGHFNEVRSWFDLEPATRELMLEALSRIYPRDCAQFMAMIPEPAAGKKEAADVSRQARHARMQRLVSAAVACCAILGTRENKFADLFFRPDFAQLRPYSMSAFAKFEALLMEGRTGEPQGWQRLWRRSTDTFFEVGARISRCTVKDAVVMHSAMSLMYGCVILGGEDFQKAWKQTFATAQRRGLLANQYINLNLSLLGAFTDVSEPYLRFASDARNHPVDSADLFLFVRRDLGADCNMLLWRIVTGRPPESAACLYQKQPGSSLTHAIQYVRTSMRRKYYFRNPGLTMAVMFWAGSIARALCDRQVQALVGITTMERLRKEFARIVRVQRMEKNRFSCAIARLGSPGLKKKIEEMWLAIQALGNKWLGSEASSPRRLRRGYIAGGL